MNDIMMGKPKKVGDNLNITDLGDGMLVLGKPDYVINPTTGNLEKIETIINTDMDTFCPHCKKKNKPGVKITITETGMMVYACKICNQFVWCRERKK